MRRERSAGSRANLELARREVAGPGEQVRRGITFAVPLLAVALRAVLEIEVLARLPLRLGPEVGTLRFDSDDTASLSAGARAIARRDTRQGDAGTTADSTRREGIRREVIGARSPWREASRP